MALIGCGLSEGPFDLFLLFIQQSKIPQSGHTYRLPSRPCTFFRSSSFQSAMIYSVKSSFGERIVHVEWGDYKQYSFLSSIVFTGIDRIGILNSILSKLSEDIMVNIQSVNVTSKDGIFEGVFNVHVHSVEDVNVLISKIAKVDGVTTVHRALI